MEALLLRFYNLILCRPNGLQLLRYFLHNISLLFLHPFFLAYSSWVAICLIAASAFLLAQVATRASCLIFSRFVTFLLVALRTSVFTNRFLSVSPSNWYYKAQYNVPSCPTAVVVDAFHMSGASLPISLYSSMMPLLYTGALLTMTSKPLKNNIATKIKIRYTIKNCSLISNRFFEQIPYQQWEVFKVISKKWS